MQRHATGTHDAETDHYPHEHLHDHLHEVSRMHGEYKSHPGRWFLDHPMLPALLVTGIIALLIIGLVSMVYLGMTTGEWSLFRA